MEKSVDIDIFFTNSVLEWSKRNLRSFYWRNHSLDPFHFLLLELMLVRTRANAVDKIAKEIFEKLPNAERTLEVEEKEILKILKPLGLYRKRTNAIRQIANIIITQYNGTVPDKYDSLFQLPFIGRYSANAILCFAFNKKSTIVDNNIARIITRFYNVKNSNKKINSNNELWEIASRLVPKKNFKKYNWGIIDLGGKICTKNPKCFDCPLNTKCIYARIL